VIGNDEVTALLLIDTERSKTSARQRWSPQYTFRATYGSPAYDDHIIISDDDMIAADMAVPVGEC